MKVTPNMSQRRRRELMTEILKKALRGAEAADPQRRILTPPILAGGYVRDWHYQVMPKDIDIFIGYMGQQPLNVLQDWANVIGDQFGVRFVVAVNPEAYGAERVVFSAEGTDDWEPIQLIFERGMFHSPVLNFDLASCKAAVRIDRSGRTTLEKHEEFDRVLRTRVDEVDPMFLLERGHAVVEHYRRIRDKLGLTNLLINMRNIRWIHPEEIQRSLNVLRENNLCEDPRQVFQTQAQGVDGDAIRQLYGAEAARAMDEVIQQQVRDMEARARAVLNNARVPTGRLFGWNNNPFARG